MTRKLAVAMMLVMAAGALTACPRHKPLSDAYRQDPYDATRTLSQPGILTGKAGEYCIYGC